MGAILGFEDLENFLSKFGVVIDFIGLYFRAMTSIEMIDHCHHSHAFRNSSDGQVVLPVLNPKFDRDLTSAFEFRYAAGNRYASGPTPMSRIMPTPVAMS